MTPVSATVQIHVCRDGMVDWPQSHILMHLVTGVPYFLRFLTDKRKFGNSSGVPRNFVRGGGVQQIQLRTEDRENGDLGAVAP
jgi:hypothetical protein